MSRLPQLLSPLVGDRVSLAFSLLLVFHVLAGLTCVITGLVAITSQKRPGRHPRFGGIYYWSLSVVFASATGLAAIRWQHDAYLFVLGAASFSAASVGYAARKIRWQGWTSVHILGMSLSYVVLLTAFYVDNGPRLPLWNRLPVIAFWIGPGLIGLPLVARALLRYAHPAADLRADAELTDRMRCASLRGLCRLPQRSACSNGGHEGRSEGIDDRRRRGAVSRARRRCPDPDSARRRG